MFDLVIRGGTIVDGTGANRFVGDLAVKDGRIVAIGGTIDGEAAEVIDATGKIVTPGFVDIHTHYDGQITWDETIDPSSGHGVTTVIAGNCGVGFAPVRPGAEEWLVQLMEGVEDIPGTALYEGITWGWESFPQYLDLLDTRKWSADVGVMIAHGPVRAYVMGDRGARNEHATGEDIDGMARIVQEAVEAGAFGCSTSRTTQHKARDGEPVPGTFAEDPELFALGRAVAAGGGGMMEVAPFGVAGESVEVSGEMDWMIRMSADLGINVTFAMMQNGQDKDLWKRQLDQTIEARANGSRLIPQVSARPFGMLLGLPSYHAFNKRPTYLELAGRLPYDDMIVEMRKPEVKAAILAEDNLAPDPSQQFDGLGPMVAHILDRVYVMGDPPDYEPTPDQTVAARAAANGAEPLDYLYDVMVEGDGKNLLMLPYLNYEDGNHDAIREMITSEATVLGLSDAGAHCRMICDASMPTYMLTHWSRDRSRGAKVSLEWAVRRQTKDTAEMVGLDDRGTLEVGKRADINVIDYDKLQLLQPRPADDLPAGGRRLLQRATGYDATIVAGAVTRRHGEDTGARPGRLIRA